ncbi:MAG: hypothetical protein WCU74_01105 [Candidatus Omnitrophota bacterium]
MLSPAWGQLKLGPLIRGESDLRIYHDLFKKRTNEIGGNKKLWIRLSYKKEKEPQDIRGLNVNEALQKRLIIFEGYEKFFFPLNEWNVFLHEAILDMTVKKWRDRVANICDIPPIGIHVRMGDQVGHRANPISWYVGILNAIRKAVGYSVSAFLVSDGAEIELKELLHQRNVCLIRTGSSISDLLTLTKAKTLIGTGCSTFTAWASFLGRIPTITIPGQDLAWYGIKQTANYLYGQFDASSLSSSHNFLEVIKSRLM